MELKKKKDHWLNHLSEAFENLSGEPKLELEVLTLNINEGHNEELMEQCQILREYAQYVNCVRKYAEELELNEAVKLAEAHRKQLAALQETERMKREMIENAKKEAADEVRKMMEEAKASMEQAKREAEKQMRRQVSRLSLEIAEKVLRKDLSKDTAQVELVDRMLDELESAQKL